MVLSSKTGKKEFIENASRIFAQTKVERDARQLVREKEEREHELMAKVGQLTIENDWLKKNLPQLTESTEICDLASSTDKLPVTRQCELPDFNRTSFYRSPKEPDVEAIEREERIKSRLDYWHTKMCYLGIRRLAHLLKTEDLIHAGRKLVKRYMEEMNLRTVYPKVNLSKRNQKHRIYPYLLRNMPIFTPNQVGSVDITYIKMGKSHMYPIAVIDWHRRFIVGYELSDTLDTAPVLSTIKRAIATYGTSAIINSDQGTQFTSEEYASYLRNEKIWKSMDGKARWVDNVLIERWFRSLKCDNLYINEYATPKALRCGICQYVTEYNTQQPHESLEYKYPIQVYSGYPLVASAA